MNKTILQRLRKPLLLLFSLFVILFVFRLIYGYVKTSEDNSDEVHFFESISNVKRNFASKEYSKSEAGAPVAASIKVDQKYEKIAEINTKSSQFEEEEKQVRKNVEFNNAIIQFEQKTGNDGYRRLHLVIGVPPEKFDTLYNSLAKIGKIQSKQITKKDKTNEYKELNARKTSLEKTLLSLRDLKAKGGQIAEFINLENRILEIEQELQDLGVNLGDFDSENEFCTVKFSLAEGKEITISFIHRLKVALEWTVPIYLKLATSLLFVVLIAYLFLLITDKLKLLERLFK